jgi:predicted acyl esterase
LWATADVLLPGYRISLEVSSSSFPRFDRNSNTGGVIASKSRNQYQPAINRILYDTAHPSHLILPLIKR